MSYSGHAKRLLLGSNPWQTGHQGTTLPLCHHVTRNLQFHEFRNNVYKLNAKCHPYRSNLITKLQSIVSNYIYKVLGLTGARERNISACITQPNQQCERVQVAHPPALRSLVTWLPAHTMAITLRNLHIIVNLLNFIPTNHNGQTTGEMTVICAYLCTAAA